MWHLLCRTAGKIGSSLRFTAARLQQLWRWLTAMLGLGAGPRRDIAPVVRSVARALQTESCQETIAPHSESCKVGEIVASDVAPASGERDEQHDVTPNAVVESNVAAKPPSDEPLPSVPCPAGEAAANATFEQTDECDVPSELLAQLVHGDERRMLPHSSTSNDALPCQTHPPREVDVPTTSSSENSQDAAVSDSGLGALPPETLAIAPNLDGTEDRDPELGGQMPLEASMELTPLVRGVGGPDASKVSGDAESSASSSRRVPPEKRGGRPRANELSEASTSRETARQSAKSKRGPLPELVCWLDGTAWRIGVEINEDAWDGTWNPDTGVQEDPDDRARWQLCCPLGEASLINEATQERRGFSSEPYRIFRLSGPGYAYGRRQRRLSRGRFLVVTPAEWKLQKEYAQYQPIEPDRVAGGDFRAHYINLNEVMPSQVVFDTADGPLAVPTGPLFELCGNKVALDAHACAGPLFYGDAPNLRALGACTYAKVVVGDEGVIAGQRQRRHASKFDDLRPWIADLRVGWFYVRLYDVNDDLIDSLDFRFAADLREVKVESHDVLPSSRGHRPVQVTVRHEPTITLVHAPAPREERLQVKRVGESSRFEIPPDASCDNTTWLLMDKKSRRRTELAIRIERLWWCLKEEGEKPSVADWSDKPVRLTSDHYKASSKHLLHFLAPPSFRGRTLSIGIDRERSMFAFSSAASSNQLIFPLRNLTCYSEFEAPTTFVEVKVWPNIHVQRHGSPCAIIATKGVRAENIQCEQTQQESKVVLTVSWNECGGARYKRLLLWGRQRPAARIYEQDIPWDATSAQVILERLKPGEYLLQLVYAESPNEFSCRAPQVDEPNVCAIQVVETSKLRVDDLFEIIQVQLPDGTTGTLRSPYTVSIQGLIINQQLPDSAGHGTVRIKTINEGWYVGTVSASDKHAPHLEEINPVKLEVDDKTGDVKAIEDRSGDGAVYCPACQCLCWKRHEQHEDKVVGPNHLKLIGRWAPS